MSTEMGATRLLAPYFGTSLLVWAALIGLVLLFLTLGYTVGGRLADRYPTQSALYKVTAWAGFAIVLVPILSQPFLNWSVQGFASLSVGVLLGSLFSILVLFSLPLMLLGTVSPWAIRLRTERISESGTSAGSLYALSTVGSLVGTFGSVLLLQPTIGTRASIWVFGIALLSISLVALAREVGRRAVPYAAMLGLAIVLVVVFNGGRIRQAEAGQLLYEDESPYNYIQVVRDQGWTELVLNEGHAVHSVYNPHRLLSGGPWDYFLLAPLFRPEGLQPPIKDVLLIGLAAGTVSNQYAAVYPQARMDGVEIDGQIVDVGRRYFDMNKPQLNAVVADGRYFLLTTSKQYDVIGIDAYRQPYIPFHLATTEFFELVNRHLKPGGVVAINTGRTPGDYRLVNAMGRTMSAVFPSVFVVDTEQYLNSLIFATKEPMTLEQFSRNAGRINNPYLATVVQAAYETGNLSRLQDREWYDTRRAAFTDDLAPVEQVIDQIILDYAQGGPKS
ncbi:MAG: fused MFS/spermidine synthase [Chloroflexota bacterium]|nr:fused MFS/spermidine synthase [Chloroflexota bacterium]